MTGAFVMLVEFTVAIFCLALLGWRRHRAIELLLIPAGLYYYSMFGAWKLLRLNAFGGYSESLDHLEKSLFTVQVNDAFFLALFCYGVFNVVVIGGLWLSTRQQWRGGAAALAQAVAAPSIVRLVLISISALVVSAAALWGDISAAIDQGVPVYLFTRKEMSDWFRLHQLLNRVGLAALACAWPIEILSNVSKRHMLRVGALLVVTLAWVGFLGMLGNRNELVAATFGGLLFYFMLGGVLNPWKGLTAGFFAYFALRTIEYLRGTAADGLVDKFVEALTNPEFWDPGTLVGGSESLAAHLSMYGIIAGNVAYTWGSSLLYLVQSLIPFFPRDARVEDSYGIYASAVGAPESQGFNIHFAAGAYLNGGVLGVVFGAVLLVGVWCLLGNVCRRLLRRSGMVHSTLFGYAIFCGLLPLTMRGGPEGLKGLVFEGFVIPFAVAFLGRVRSCTGLRPRRLVCAQTKMA